MEERDFLLSIKGKIEKYHEAQDNLNRDDLYEGNDYRASSIKQSKKEYGSDEEKYWMEALEETKEFSTRKEIIEKIKTLRQQRVDELKKEISDEVTSFKENFVKENEAKQKELEKERRKVNSTRRGLEKEKIEFAEAKQKVPKKSSTYKVADEEQKERIEKIKLLCKKRDDITTELKGLKQQKRDFLIKYDGIDCTTESGIDKLNGIADEKQEEEMMKKRMVEKEQAIAEAESMKSQIEKADEQEARKLEEEIMKKRLEEKNSNDVPPQKGKNVTDVPPQNPMQNKIEIVIGRQATVKVGENSENVDKKYIKEARNIIFLRQFLKDNNINLENINMPELDKNFSKNKMIDPVVMTAIIKSKSLDEKQRQEILEGYLKGNLESSEIKIVYDLGDLSKTSILNRIFSRTEVNLSEKEKMLRYAEVANENGIAEVRGQYRPNKFISMMSGMVKRIRNIKELLPSPKSKTYGLSDGKEAADYTLSKEERKMFESMMSNAGKYKGIKIESKTNTTVRDEIDNPDKTYHSIEEANNDGTR